MKHQLLPPDIEAAIFFQGEQLLFCQRDSGEWLKPIATQTLRAALSGVAVDSGWLPPGVLRCGESAAGPWAVLWIPPARHRLQLAPDVEAPLPAFVFGGVGRRYAVWAVGEREFAPTLPAYHAPLPNVHPDGTVCWGQNRPPEAKPQKLPAVWRLFVESPFNGDLCRGKSQACPDDVREQLHRLGKVNVYPLDDLVPLNLTIAECLQSFLRAGGLDDVDA